MSDGVSEREIGKLAEVDRQVGRRVPGIAVAVVDIDQGARSDGWGVADIGNRVAMDPKTVCNWFSMTKLVTATVALQLADQGLLDLDAPITEYYARFSIMTPNRRARAVTARHLLSHSSGVANPMPMRWAHLATEPGPNRSQFVGRLIDRHHRLRSDPGTKAAYSNLGYLVLGEVIEAASGRTFEDCVTRGVLDPLAMTTTGFAAHEGSTWATPYQRRHTPLNLLLPLLVPREIVGPRVEGFRSLHHFYVDGAPYGGLVGPVTDAARFLQAHLGDGAADGARILGPESARAMRTIVSRGTKLRTGLGWYVRGRTPNQGYVEHLGGGAGFWNCMRLYPDRGIGVVTMGNASSYDHAALADALAGAGTG